MEGADYVLQDFPNAERQIIVEVLERTCQVVQIFITSGIVTAMNQYNGVLSKE